MDLCPRKISSNVHYSESWSARKILGNSSVFLCQFDCPTGGFVIKVYGESSGSGTFKRTFIPRTAIYVGHQYQVFEMFPSLAIKVSHKTRM